MCKIKFPIKFIDELNKNESMLKQNLTCISCFKTFYDVMLIKLLIRSATNITNVYNFLKKICNQRADSYFKTFNDVSN